MDEQKILADVLEQYRKGGYQVWVEPRGPDLPPFLPSSGVDAIAKKGTQTVIFQAKVRGGTNEEELPSILLTDEPDIAYAESILRELERLLNPETARSALLLAWAGVESVMRAIARREKVAVDKLGPTELLDLLYERQTLTEQEHRDLVYCMYLRNAVAHGFRASDVPADAVFLLMNLISRLLQTVKGEHRKGGALLTTVVGGELKQVDSLRHMVREATELLEEIVGNSSGIVTAQWERAEAAGGETVVTLRLSDFLGSVTATFEPKELRNKDHLGLRLRRVWGDLLQARSERQLKELRKSQRGGK
jgi:hypothetical protein